MNRVVYPGAFDQALYDVVASANDNRYLFSFNKFGFNGGVDTGVEEDVWDAGGNYEYAENADFLRLVSDSADDSPSGQGVDVVSLYGLDENWNLAGEDLTLDGTTPVLSVNRYIRLYRIRCISSPSADPNSDATGTISAFNNTENILQGQVVAGNTSTKMTHFTVPSGYTGFMSNIAISGGPNDDFICDLQLRRNGDIFYTATDVEISNSNTYIDRFMPNLGPIQETSDVKFKAIGVTNNSTVRVSYIIRLIENDYLARLTRSLG